jgi:hypothetical protein
MVSFGSEIFLLCFTATVLTFFIAGLLYLLCFEHVDNLGAYSIPSETGLLIPSVAVEKGTKAVILANSGVCRERGFNNLRTTFVAEIPRKEFLNSHACFRQLTTNGSNRWLSC